MRGLLPMFVALASPALALGQTPAEPTLVIRDVAVVSPASGAVERGRTVEVTGDRITRVGPAEEARRGYPSEAIVVDGRGRFLVPGLADMHVHFSSDTLALGVLLAHGVTRARIMSGSPEALALRDGVSSGAIPGPALTVAGPLLAGEEVPWGHELVTTAEEARRAAEAHVAAGYDYLKIYDGLTVEAYEAIRQVSDSTTVPMIGHVPVEVGMRRVLEAGQRSIEHVEQILYAHFGRDGVMSLSPERALSATRPFTQTERASEDVFVVPTLAGMERLMLRGTSWTEEQFEQPAMAWVNPDLLGWWASIRAAPPDSARLATRRNFVAIQEALIRALHDSGVTIMAGTDTPYPLLVPGLALHQELRKYVELGISPAEALATATSASARFLGSAGELGIVAEGAAADMLLVAKNPLEDLSTLERPEAVVRAGEYLNRGVLDQLLEAAQGGYAADRP